MSNATCTGLTNGTTYTVSVTATGPGGTSSAMTIKAIPPVPVPRGTTDKSQLIGASGTPVPSACSVAQVPPVVAGVTVTTTCGSAPRTVNFTPSAAVPVGTVVTVTVTYTQNGPQIQTEAYIVT